MRSGTCSQGAIWHIHGRSPLPPRAGTLGCPGMSNGRHWPAPWVFARELLIEGLLHSAGTGDVRVHREADVPGQAGPARVHISLNSPEGRALLTMLPRDLETFLAKTRAVVVYGSEHRHMRVPWETLTEELWWHPNPHR
jgi:Streptomyces sporulation and cell division protein, SsgA